MWYYLITHLRGVKTNSSLLRFVTRRAGPLRRKFSASSSVLGCQGHIFVRQWEP